MRDSRVEEIFFAKQEIKNACATQAILSVLLNIQHHDIELGPTLTEFKEFAGNFTPAVSRLFVCLLVCLFICLLVCLFICLLVYLLVCLLVCLFICLFICLSLVVVLL